MGFAEEAGQQGEQNETRPGVIKVNEMLNARLKIEITDGCESLAESCSAAP
jgi:hypothetical protein